MKNSTIRKKELVAGKVLPMFGNPDHEVRLIDADSHYSPREKNYIWRLVLVDVRDPATTYTIQTADPTGIFESRSGKEN